MKLKYLNLIPLVLFPLIYICRISVIDPMIIIIALTVMNIVISQTTNAYAVSSAMLLISTVIGMVIATYCYFYFISADSETPIVGAFFAIVYGIFVVLFAGIGAVIIAVKNRRQKS